MAEDDRRAGRAAWRAVPVAEGAPGLAPAPERRAGEGAVRGAGRAGGPAVRARGAVRPVPDGGLRRLHLDQGAGHAAEPWLAGEDEVIVTCAGGTRYCGSGG